MEKEEQMNKSLSIAMLGHKHVLSRETWINRGALSSADESGGYKLYRAHEGDGANGRRFPCL